MRINRTVVAIIAVATSAAALPAAADTRIEYVDERTGKTQSVLSIRGNEARMDSAGDTGYTLFDAGNGALTIVNPRERTFTVMDEASMNAMSRQVASAMAEMRAQLDQMPPEQRAMVEKMMGGMGNAGKSMLETKVERTGRIMTRAGYDCEQVFFSVGNVSRTELCVVDAGEIEMPDADRATLNAMHAAMRAMAENMMSNFGMESAPDMEALGGMPVYTKHSNEESGEVLKSVTHDGIDASLFTIPDGYREEKLQAGK
ncbi:MAG TPA: DUF4412 domain-containing protein [Gammaproteobacteria bacterium]